MKSISFLHAAKHDTLDKVALDKRVDEEHGYYRNHHGSSFYCLGCEFRQIRILQPLFDRLRAAVNDDTLEKDLQHLFTVIGNVDESVQPLVPVGNSGPKADCCYYRR